MHFRLNSDTAAPNLPKWISTGLMLASSVAWVQHLQTMVLFSRVLYSPSPVFGRSEALHILQIFYVCIFAGYDAFQMCGLAMKDEPPRLMDLVRRSEVLSLVVRAGAAIFSVWSLERVVNSPVWKDADHTVSLHLLVTLMIQWAYLAVALPSTIGFLKWTYDRVTEKGTHDHPTEKGTYERLKEDPPSSLTPEGTMSSPTT